MDAETIMPGMGGKEVFTALKSLNPDVKVLLSSGYDINAHIREALDNGCQGFIQKPFNLQLFSSKTHQILNVQHISR